ncbi:MAG TPA: class I SAM-dependent methyltransferase [Candidatus Omnitrophota bacterium]|nr:class I SAM-dependent methyltransferase [Candidatus Omnitrophota bacterium]
MSEADGGVDLCLSSDPRVIENHKKLEEREALFLSYGYDLERERTQILDQAGIFCGRILEAGTGKGYFSIVLARRGYPFTSFDVSREDQEIARLNLKYYGLDHLADLREENGEQLSFRNRSFATVFSVNTLHHLENPFRVLDELVRVLSMKGKLVLSDFNEEGFALMDAIHAREGRVHGRGKCSMGEAGDWLEKKGFRIKKSETRFQTVYVSSRRP